MPYFPAEDALAALILGQLAGRQGAQPPQAEAASSDPILDTVLDSGPDVARRPQMGGAPEPQPSFWDVMGDKLPQYARAQFGGLAGKAFDWLSGPEEGSQEPQLGSPEYIAQMGKSLTDTARIPQHMAQGFATDMANTGKVLGRHMKQEQAYQLRGDETMMDNGDIYRDGKLVGNMAMQQNDMIRAAREVADLAPMSAFGYSASKVLSGQGGDLLRPSNQVNTFFPPEAFMNRGDDAFAKARLSALDEAKPMWDDVLPRHRSDAWSALLDEMPEEDITEEMVEELATKWARDDVWMKTGWVYDPNGKNWMSAVDDSGLRFRPKMQEKGYNDAVLKRGWRGKYGDMVEGSEAMKYSNVADTPLELKTTWDNGFDGKWTPGSYDDAPGPQGEMKMWMRPDTGMVDDITDEQLSVLSHEGQHHVANQFDMPQKGASPDMFYNSRLTPPRSEAIGKEIAETGKYTKPRGKRGMPFAEPERAQRFFNAYGKQLKFADDTVEFMQPNMKKSVRDQLMRSNAARKMYDYDAGEAYARAVQEQRKAYMQYLDIGRYVDEAQSAVDGSAAPRLKTFDEFVREKPISLWMEDVGAGFERQHITPKELSTGTFGGYASAQPRGAEPAMPRRTNAKGDIAGAPPGVRTEADIDALAEKLVGQAQTPEGQAGRGFYEGFAKSIDERTDDIDTARRYTTGYGLTSNLAPVTDNVGYANTALNQRNMGMPIKAGRFPDQSGAQITEAFDEGRLPDSHKAGRFAHHLLPERFQKAGDDAGAVLDEHMGTAFGYPQNAQGAFRFSPSQTRFGDEVMDRTIAKGKARGIPDFDEATAQEMIWGDERARKGLSGYPSPEEIMEQNSSFTQVEAMPGATTGVSQKLKDLPMAERQQITDEMLNAAGDSNMSRIFGTMTKKGEPGQGWFDGGVNPNRMYQMGTGTVGTGKNRVLDPASKKAADLGRHTMQLVLGQDGSGLTSPRPLTAGMSKNEADIVYFEMGKRLQGETHDKLFKALEDELGPEWGNGTFQAPYKNGFIMKNISGVPNKEFQAAMKRVHNKAGASGMQLMRDVGGDYTGINWEKGEYKQLLDQFDTPELKEVFNTKVTKLLGSAQGQWEKIAKRYGIETNSVLDDFRRIGSRGGMSAIRQAIKDGILPAGALMFAVHMMGDEEA